jgi:predicted transcriptional regulator
LNQKTRRGPAHDRTTIALDPEVMRRAQHLAIDRRLSLSALIELALVALLEEEAREPMKDVGQGVHLTQ